MLQTGVKHLQSEETSLSDESKLEGEEERGSPHRVRALSFPSPQRTPASVNALGPRA